MWVCVIDILWNGGNGEKGLYTFRKACGTWPWPGWDRTMPGSLLCYALALLNRGSISFFCKKLFHGLVALSRLRSQLLVEQYSEGQWWELWI